MVSEKGDGDHEKICLANTYNDGYNKLRKC